MLLIVQRNTKCFTAASALRALLAVEPLWRQNGFILKVHDMPNLSIKEVPEEIAEALRQRAARNHRSLQGELMAIIEQAAQSARTPEAAAIPAAVGERRGTRTIEDIAAELRARYPEPLRGGPLAVDIIRADRDSR